MNNIIKGIILAGGTGSRLCPLTKVTNKHLLPVYNEPMIYKVIRTLSKSNIKDITIVLGGESVGEIVRLLGNGSKFDVKLTYIYQQQAGGIAEALYITENNIRGYKTAVILGDNIFEDTFEEDVKDWINRDLGCGCKIFLKAVKNPERFGVAEVMNGKIVKITEKPTIPLSDFAVTGFYLYDEYLFYYIEHQINTVGYSSRGELEITDLNNIYLKNNKLDFKILNGFWSDAGTFDTLLKSSNFIKNKSDN